MRNPCSPIFCPIFCLDNGEGQEEDHLFGVDNLHSRCKRYKNLLGS
jgi:hypothetical protein